MKELVLIDGNYWLFSSYYATASTGNLMMNKDGIPTNAVYGFANRLETVINQHPDSILVAFDAKGKTFRNEEYEDYKGTRKETPEELKCQFPIVREYLDAHNIPRYEIEGYEGDDVIGTMARQASEAGYHVSIMTGDKDMMQLVSDHIDVYKRNVKTKNDDIYNVDTINEKYGLKPDQIRDFLGLMGDSADNIPGIKGVGEKTALKLLKQYDSVEGIDAHKDEIKGKMGEKIRENIDMGLKSKEIATILTDVPVTISLDDCVYKDYDVNTLKAFYSKYNMNSFLKKLTIGTFEKEELKFEIVSHMPVINEDSAIVAGLYDHNYHKSIILGYGLYNRHQSYFISYEDALNDQAFLAYLSDENYHKYSYNIKSQIIGSKWNGIEINGMDFDLQLATYILNPSLKDEIKYICDFYDYEDIKFEEEVFGKGAKRHIPALEDYASYIVSEAKAVYTLKDETISRLHKQGQYELYENIELPITYILGDMEYYGASVDVNILKELEESFDKEIKQIEEDIYMLAGEEFNIASPKQLGDILFVKLGLPYGKKTKTGYSTSQEVLEKIQDYHPIVPLIQRYRMLTKLSSTYLKGLQEQVFPDGKIHTIYNQALTQTGRLSSTDPNLQNIPVRQDEGKLIRKAFVASNDYLISFDYSQIELRILAHMADVKLLLQAFNEDKDIHTYTASLIFDVDEKDVTKDMRRKAKAINFGIIYGMGEYRLSKEINVSLKEARDFIARYFTQYPEIKTFMDGVVEKCKEDGYVSTLLNRKRYISTINDKNYSVREQAKRFAMNTPIQGSGADIMKVAMIKVYKRMKDLNLKSKMILQVHDELIFDVYEDELDTMMQIIDEEMESAVDLKVRLKADGSYAKNWYDLK